jgi:hypothetical protein
VATRSGQHEIARGAGDLRRINQDEGSVDVERRLLGHPEAAGMIGEHEGENGSKANAVASMTS